MVSPRANASRVSRWWKREPAQADAEAPPSFNGSGDAGAADLHERYRLLRTLNYPHTSIGQMLDQTAQRYPDVPALHFGEQRWTYGELLTLVNRLAGGMAQRGVRRGDRVVMALPNSPDYVLCFLALQKLGAVVVNAGPLMGTDDLRELLRMTEPRMMIALDLQAGTQGPVASERPKMTWVWSSLKAYQPLWKRMGYQVKRWQARDHLYAHEAHTSVKGLFIDAPSRPPTIAPSPEDVALLQPSGGTTGTLKVAELTHHGLLCNATQLSAWSHMRSGQERFLALLPMFHVYGLMMGLILPALNASLILPMPRFALASLMDLLREHEPNVLPIVPTVADMLCEELESRPDRAVLGVLRRAFVISGAAPLPEATSERFEKLTGSQLVQGYGLTEASPVTHANPLLAPRAGSIGLALPDTQTRLADLDDPARDAPPGEPGELVVRGPQLMRGYYRNETETARMLRKDDRGRIWLYTGDVARLDEDGYVYLIDRRKNVINHAGLKIWPARVEHVLQAHPNVRDAAVIGRPDATYGEAVAAILVTRDGTDTSKLVDELRGTCRQRLAPYEVPTRFEFVEQLPRTALGKLLKYRLNAEATVAEEASGGGAPDREGAEASDPALSSAPPEEPNPEDKGA